MKSAAISSRLSLLSPEVALAVDPARMRALLEGAYAPQLAKLVRRDRLATARALWGRKVPLLVAQRLEQLAWLATPAGHDAVLEAARDLKGWDQTGWATEGPADLAARLLADAVRQHPVLLRAALRLARRPIERPTYELRARAPRQVPPGRAGEPLVAALRAVAGATDAWVHDDEDTGDLHAVVLYGDRADAFRFRVAEGRLAVTAFLPHRLDAYGAAWSRALYDSKDFFLDEPSVTLRPLHELGSDGLRAATEHGKLLREVLRVRVLTCTVEGGGGHRLEAHGPDALAFVARHLRDGGRLVRATVRVEVSGETRAVDCVVHPPNRLDVGWGGVARSGARGPRLAREALERLGLLSPPDPSSDDITTLRPLVQPAWRWFELAEEKGYEQMLAAPGLLEDVDAPETRRVSSPGLRRFDSAVADTLFEEIIPAAGGEAPVDPDAPEGERQLVEAMRDATVALRGLSQYYVVPDDPALQAFTIDQRDMVMQRLSLGALVRKARKEMGLERGDAPRGLPTGVLWVGEMRVEGGVVRFFYLVRAATDDKDRAAIGRGITRAAAFGRAVVMVPKGRKLGRDFVEVELDVKQQLGAASWRGKLGEAVRALGIEDRVAPELVVPEGVRLVVDTRRQRVLLDGVALVKLGENGYRLLKVLAEKSGVAEMVSTRETDKAISGARQTPGATRYTVWKMRSWIERSFAEAGRRVPADVREGGIVRAVGRKGWALTMKATAV